MRLIAVLCSLLTLAGCITPQQQERARQQQVADDMAQCSSYGFRPGSDAFANCRLELETARQQRYYYYDRPPRIHTGFYYWH